MWLAGVSSETKCKSQNGFAFSLSVTEIQVIKLSGHVSLKIVCFTEFLNVWCQPIFSPYKAVLYFFIFLLLTYVFTTYGYGYLQTLKAVP